MKIRRLTGSDGLDGAIELLCRFFSEEGFDTSPEIIAAHARQLAGIETCGLFIAEDQGKAVGVATVSMEFGIEYGWWAEMGDLYLVPGYRERGLSRQLVEAVEKFLKDRGCAGYQVTVTPFSGAQHGLARYYGRLGFESEGRLILRKRI